MVKALVLFELHFICYIVDHRQYLQSQLNRDQKTWNPEL